MKRVQRVPGATWRLLPTGVLVRRPGPAQDAVLLTGAAALVWCALDQAHATDPVLIESPDSAQAIRMLTDAGLVIDAD